MTVLQNYSFLSGYGVNIPSKVNPDLFKKLLKLPLHMYLEEVLFLIVCLYNTMILTFYGWEASSHNGREQLCSLWVILRDL